MTIGQIYSEFFIPLSLQKHMLRVAALAEILVNSWATELEHKEEIIKTSLFHDIAKPMKFDLSKQAQFGMKPKDIEKLAKHQKHLEKKYGKNEHLATVAICKEIGLSQESLRLLNNLEWKYIPRLISEQDIDSLIPIYCDMRIGPSGILSLKQRLLELKNRVSEQDYETDIKNGFELEKIIQENIVININSITHSQIEIGASELIYHIL